MNRSRSNRAPGTGLARNYCSHSDDGGDVGYRPAAVVVASDAAAEHAVADGKLLPGRFWWNAALHCYCFDRQMVDSVSCLAPAPVGRRLRRSEELLVVW